MLSHLVLERPLLASLKCPNMFRNLVDVLPSSLMSIRSERSKRLLDRPSLKSMDALMQIHDKHISNHICFHTMSMSHACPSDAGFSSLQLFVCREIISICCIHKLIRNSKAFLDRTDQLGTVSYWKILWAAAAL